MKKSLRSFLFLLIISMLCVSVSAAFGLQSTSDGQIAITSSEEKDALLVAALYDPNRFMSRAAVRTCRLSVGDQTVSVEDLLPLEREAGQTAKVFLLASGGTPLCEPLALSPLPQDALVSSMVKIPARADFAFRSDTHNAAAGEQSPIMSDYYLCKYKVTNREYKQFTDETGRKVPSYWKNGTYPAGKADHPVLNVSYSDAAAYCAWISEQYEHWHFRLPTEAEWENAAIGAYYGDASVKYPAGAQTPSYDAAAGTLQTTFNYNGVIASELLRTYGSEYPVTYIKGDFTGQSEPLGSCISISASGGVTNWANHGGSATGGYFLQTDLYAQISADGGNTSPVGQYPANTLGLYDMAGNCWDLTSSQILAVNGLEAGVLCYAVRGGSWYATARSCTFSYRGEGRKDSPSATVGFRLAADYIG